MRIPAPSGKFGVNTEGIDKSKRSSEKRSAKGVSRDKVNDMNFLKELDTATEDQLKKSLDELMEELKEQADTLMKHRTFEELDKYRSLVKAFMDKAIKKIYSVKVSESSKFMVKRKKVFIIVERVDAELEELAKKVLGQNAEQMDILASLEKINGMLVDMYS